MLTFVDRTSVVVFSAVVSALIQLAETIDLSVSNRDGDVLIGKGVNGVCYLIVQSDSFHKPAVFEGLGSVEYREIPNDAYEALKLK